jgi:predicted regulator of amino acid metabolism with ACT domain
LYCDGACGSDRSVRHVVEVVLQDPLLRAFLLELARQLRLADLALDVALRVVDVERAHELLGDCRAALQALARLEVLDPGTDDRAVVDAAVLVEVRVLDRDRGVAQIGGHLVPVDRRSDLVRLDVAES